MLYTIGHSNMTAESFISLLKLAGIGLVVDVRSIPQSRFVQFSQRPLERLLQAHDIQYVYRGRTLGGRDVTPAGYDARATTLSFKLALRELIELPDETRPVLMCSEHDPLECHRCLLIGRQLAAENVSVAHVLRDGRIEPHEEAEERLMKLTRQTEGDLIATRSERLALAYMAQSQALERRSKGGRLR